MTAMLRMPRRRGVFSGSLLILFGLWGGLAALAGPYLHFAFAPDTAWKFTTGRIELQVAPAGAAVLGGLALALSANRVVGTIGGCLGALGGAWLVVGAPLSTLWSPSGSPLLGAALGNHTRQVLEQVGLLSGLGTVLAFVSGLAIARLTAATVKDARLLEERRQAQAEEEDGAEATRMDIPRQLVGTARDVKVAGEPTDK